MGEGIVLSLFCKTKSLEIKANAEHPLSIKTWVEVILLDPIRSSELIKGKGLLSLMILWTKKGIITSQAKSQLMFKALTLSEFKITVSETILYR